MQELELAGEEEKEKKKELTSLLLFSRCSNSIARALYSELTARTASKRPKGRKKEQQEKRARAPPQHLGASPHRRLDRRPLFFQSLNFNPPFSPLNPDDLLLLLQDPRGQAGHG